MPQSFWKGYKIPLEFKEFKCKKNKESLNWKDPWVGIEWLKAFGRVKGLKALVGLKGLDVDGLLN